MIICVALFYIFAAVAAVAMPSPLASDFVSLGDRLARAYTVYAEQPITISDAIAQGYQPLNSTCDPLRGIAFGISGTAAEHTPVILYFTSGGQIAGVGTYIFGSVETSLLQSGFFEQTGYDVYHISVAFRNATMMCSDQTDPGNKLGDRLVVMPHKVNLQLPLTVTEAAAMKYHRGSCFSGMGTHWFLDLLTAPNMSWQSANLSPVVVMFDESSGLINAIFFASSTVQQSLLPPAANEWEPIPLPNILMCKNFCDPSTCTFSGTYAWSTMHFYFRDYKQVTCPSAYKCFSSGVGCCPP